GNRRPVGPELGAVVLILVSLSAGAAEGSLAQAHQLYESYKYAEAEAMLKVLPADTGRPGEVADLLGLSQAKQGHGEDAVDSMKRALKAAPKNAQYHFDMAVAQAVHVNDVSIFRKLSVAHDIRDQFKRAIELDPDLFKAQIALLQYYLNAPSIAGGGRDKAEAQAKRMADLKPAWGMRAQAQMAMKDKQFDNAASLFRKALKLQPDMPGCKFSLAVAYEKQESWDKAWDVLWHLVSGHRDWNPSAEYQLGRIAAMTGEHAEAGEAALRGYIDHPRDYGMPTASDAHWRLGMIEEKAGRMDAALREYRTAVKLDDDNDEAHQSLEALQARTG
ncbi:MAG: tetratricopeptide repeat protein, partial [Gammaproteobacteria bacterium]